MTDDRKCSKECFIDKAGDAWVYIVWVSMKNSPLDKQLRAICTSWKTLDKVEEEIREFYDDQGKEVIIEHEGNRLDHPFGLSLLNLWASYAKVMGGSDG